MIKQCVIQQRNKQSLRNNAGRFKRIVGKSNAANAFMIKIGGSIVEFSEMNNATYFYRKLPYPPFQGKTGKVGIMAQVNYSGSVLLITSRSLGEILRSQTARIRNISIKTIEYLNEISILEKIKTSRLQYQKL